MSLENKTTKSLRLWLLLLFWPVIIGVGYWLTHLDNNIHVDDEFRYWSLAHLFLHSTPIFLHILKYHKVFKFPFIEILAAFNIVHFALPIFFIELEDFQFGILSVDAMQEMFTCYLVFYSAFYIFLNLKIKVKGVEFVPPGAKLNVLKLYGYIFLGFYVVNALLSVAAIYHIGYVGFFVYIGLFLNLWREKLLKSREKILYVVIVLFDFIDRALDGLLSPFALLVLFIVISVLMAKANKWIIVVSITVFVWFYSVFSSVKYEFRTRVWYSSGFTMLDKVLLVQELYADRKLNQGTPLVNEYDGKNHMLWRFSYQVSAMSLVLQETPSRVPYWNGETYIPLISKFIPRFMWPDKPTEGMGYKFGVTYRVLSIWNTSTSINTPVLAELYMNFGYTGLYIGAFALGFVYFLLVRWFNSRSVSFASSIVGMAIIFPLMIWESNFSLLFGNLLLITVTFIILYRVMRFFTDKR